MAERNGGVRLNSQGHPVDGFQEKMENLTNTIFRVLPQQGGRVSTWRTGGAGATADPQLQAQ